jgi:hypothetical protein
MLYTEIIDVCCKEHVTAANTALSRMQSSACASSHALLSRPSLKMGLVPWQLQVDLWL